MSVASATPTRAELVASARNMRSDGKTLREISEALGKPKGTVAHWVRGVVPTNPQWKPPPSRWTPDSIVAAFHKWVELYGETPSSTDWNPSLCRQRGMPQRQARFLSGDWPHAATVITHFGTWSAGVMAAGLYLRRGGCEGQRLADPAQLSRRDLERLRSAKGTKDRVGPAELTHSVRAVAEAEKTGEPELLTDALLELAAVAVAWADRTDR